MNEDELKTLVEHIAVTIEEYLELVALKKDLMTQKTYSAKKQIYAESLGSAVGRLIEVRLHSGSRPVESDALGGLEHEMKNLGTHLIEFIDKRIQGLPPK